LGIEAGYGHPNYFEIIATGVPTSFIMAEGKTEGCVIAR
jgi:hypothetical protein